MNWCQKYKRYLKGSSKKPTTTSQTQASYPFLRQCHNNPFAGIAGGEICKNAEEGAGERNRV